MESLKVNQIIRNINLYILSDIKLEEPYLSIYEDLEDKFSNLETYDYYGNVYYGKPNGDLYIKLSQNSNNIFIDTNNVWESFLTKYKLNQISVSKIIGYALELFLSIDIEGKHITNLHILNSKLREGVHDMFK